MFTCFVNLSPSLADTSVKGSVSVNVVKDITLLYWDSNEMKELLKLLKNVKKSKGKSSTINDLTMNNVVIAYGLPTGGGGDNVTLHY